jgi:hypothetical protein
MNAKLWKKLSTVFSVHQDSENFSNISDYRLKYYESWRLFRKNYYPTDKVLKSKNLNEIYNVWTLVGEFCQVAHFSASVVIAKSSVDPQKDGKIYSDFDPETIFGQDNHLNCSGSMKLMAQLIGKMFVYLDEAIFNEQKGNFDLARLAYKKTRILMRVEAMSDEYNDTYVKVLLSAESILLDIESNWEDLVNYQMITKLTSMLQINVATDMFKFLTLNNYQNWARLKEDYGTPKDLKDLSQYFKKIFAFIEDLRHSLNCAKKLFSAASLQKTKVDETYGQSKTNFLPWYTPEEERTTLPDLSLAHDLLQKIESIFFTFTEKTSLLEITEKVNNIYCINRKKYSTLTKQPRKVFGLSSSSQNFNQKKTEDIQYVDDLLQHDSFTISH